jgi:hypothetical protein
MIGFITTVALDVTLGVAWWLTKQVTYGTIYTIRYIVS